MHTFVFWQKMLTPHMMGLANALVARGHQVYFFAVERVSSERAKQGWVAPESQGVVIRVIENTTDAVDLIHALPTNAVHLIQGVRGNGSIQHFAKKITQAGQKFWVLMETVHDEGGIRGWIKKKLYELIFLAQNKKISGIFAIGADTPYWLLQRGFPFAKIKPFTYFVPRPLVDRKKLHSSHEFVFGFLGNIESWKNPSLLIEAFLDLNLKNCVLLIAGDGAQKSNLSSLVRKNAAESRIRFLGRLPMPDVGIFLSSLDCLVLPSNIDGWGVVASEAMLVGTPVICSTACGAKAAVSASPGGRVFSLGSKRSLAESMQSAFSDGKVDELRRDTLRHWSECLTSDFGARYVEAVIDHSEDAVVIPDWLNSKNLSK